MFRADGAVALMLLLCLSCRESRENNSLRAGPDTLQLVPVDTVGVSAGDDSQVFGEIGEAGCSPTGELVVLDRTTCRLIFFDQTNLCVRTMGGCGSGPGEFLSPTDFAFLSDGKLAVADWGARTVWLFDDSLRFAGSMGVFYPGSPSGIEPGRDGSIIGVGIRMEASEQRVSGESFLGRWNRTGEETVSYLATPIRVVPENEDQIRIEYNELLFAVGSDGDVFAAEASDSIYRITGFTEGGESFLEISEPWERVARTDAELSDDSLASHGGVASPELFRQAVAGLAADENGQLWVRLGSVPHPMFIVYSREGDTLFFAECASLPDTMFTLGFSCSAGGLLAWDTDPLDYPKIIRLEFADQLP